MSRISSIPGLILAGLLAASALAASKASAEEVDATGYAAVAFSNSTGKYGYGYNFDTRGQAESEALSKCKADDAKIVGWVNNGWLVLVIGDNKGYGVGWEYGGGAQFEHGHPPGVGQLQAAQRKNQNGDPPLLRQFQAEVLSWDPAIDPSKIKVEE